MSRTLFFLLTVHFGTESGEYIGEENYIVIAEEKTAGHKRALSSFRKQGKHVLFDDISEISFDELQKIKEVKTINVYEYTGSVRSRY